MGAKKTIILRGLGVSRQMIAVMTVIFFLLSCHSSTNEKLKPVRLITLDPGHFHAALVQKSMYPQVDSNVYVYAPDGADLKLHLDRIQSYNNRKENPTSWNEQVYTGDDFFDKMITERKGNVVVLSGNNQKKTEYILKTLQAGLNVLADKPMIISQADFNLLLKAFEIAREKNLLLFDIMTERFEITTILQREFSLNPEIFGTLQHGTADDPAITKESVHYFYKYVSGSVLTRPAWFMDVKQQGEGLVDVMTHLVDLVQWECFPELALDTTDVSINSAKRWTTSLSKEEFKTVTKQTTYPDYLLPYIMDDTLRFFCNGEINYQLKGFHVKTSVVWKFKAPEGAGDTHYSIMRGTKSNLIIRQSAGENYKPVLYIEPLKDDGSFEKDLLEQFKTTRAKYPGIELKKTKSGWMVLVPPQYNEGHEAHFARVMEKFLEYVAHRNIPRWEISNMITKYYTTSQGLKKASEVSNGNLEKQVVK